MDTPRTTPPPPPEHDPGFDWRPYGSPEEPAFSDAPPRPRSGLDFSWIFVLIDALRRAVPRDLDEQFTRLIREALLTLRSLIDWYLERLDRPRREPQVEDIPID